jgi:hypothetical protein
MASIIMDSAGISLKFINFSSKGAVSVGRLKTLNGIVLKRS